MIIYDPLYGRFQLPPYLSRLVLTPEVRRLSQIRLLNTVTPSIATLGELRRYSHTLGVLYLCEKNRSPGYSRDERKALAASVLLHDIGTLPFGHLIEYLTNWNHEEIISAVLWGSDVPENRAHQIFARRAIEFRSALKRSGISFELVEAIVRKKHPLSALLFGTLDLDNLDNVARMASALGIGRGAELAVQLASSLVVDRDSNLWLAVEEQEAVRQWAALRRKAYEVIVFDPPTVAAQAVLSEAIKIGIRKGLVSEQKWSLSDEQLLELLAQDPDTKDAINLEYLGTLPPMVFCIQIAGSLRDFNLSARSNAEEAAQTALSNEFSTDRVLTYVFIDCGTFEKQLQFCDPATKKEWEIGQKSNSIVFYGFVHTRKNLPEARCKKAAENLLTWLGVSSNQLLSCEIGTPTVPADERQRSFDLKS